MPKSPLKLTIASFLKSPLATSPSRGKKGKKRKLSISPSLPIGTDSKKVSLKPKHAESQPPSSPLGPTVLDSPSQVTPALLPYQLRPKKSTPRNNSKLSPSALSCYRMDASLLEPTADEVDIDPQTLEEMEDLLREDPPIVQTTGSAQTEANSPTAAVKAAIEAKIAEEMSSEIQLFDANTKIDANKKYSTPLPPGPRPLFPNGLPVFEKSKPKATVHLKSNDNSTYAAKASSPPKNRREIVENILFVYATHTTKAPLSLSNWGLIDKGLIELLVNQDPTNPTMARIANSGYDAAHRCGFIACRDKASEDWCKAAIRRISSGGIFRAWAKGEQPETRLVRLFFPSRFDQLSEEQLIPLIKRYNAPLMRGNITMTNSEEVQGGRAVYLELDLDSFSYVRSRSYKVEFIMMDIDCQMYVPYKKPAPVNTVPGVTKIVQASSANSSQKPSGQNSRATKDDPRLNKPNKNSSGNSAPVTKLPNDSVDDPKKRGREDPIAKDAAKKPNNQNSISK